MVTGLLLYLLIQLSFYIVPVLSRISPKTWRSKIFAKPHDQQSADWPSIRPLEGFDWEKKEPLRIRPFKPVYHLSMGLQRCDPSTLVETDNTYLTRIMLRRQLMAQHPRVTLAVNAAAISPVFELYHWLMSTYLPTRFPSMFELHGSQLLAKVTHELFPVDALSLSSGPSTKDTGSSSAATVAALRTLSSIIDCDFLILLPHTTQNGGKKYVLEAYVVTFPSGFNSRSKLSLPLAKIHEPVPSYAQKLEKSMDRYFERLEVGKWVQRANWTIQTDSKLYTPGDEEGSGGNHLRPGQEPPKVTGKVDVSTCHLRNESQKLFRMPSGAIVFAFKTYLTPLTDVKGEGRDVSLALAEAIDGMREGSAPGVYNYKRAFEWGDTVMEYLREGWEVDKQDSECS